MKTIKVNEGCVCCGICTQKTELLVEDESGKAVPAARCVIKDEDLPAIEAIVAECPVKALQIVTKYEGERLEGAALKILSEELKKKLNALPKLQVSSSDVAMKPNDYHINTPYPRGEYEYKYSSESKAKRAGLDEFNRIAYSQGENMILGVVAQYKVDKLKKYYTLDKGSFWGEANERFQKALAEFAAEVEGRTNGRVVLPQGFADFEAYPGYERKLEKNTYTYKLAHIDEPSTSAKILRELKNKYSKDSYEVYIDTDSSEEYVGESMWHDSYKTMYCYCDVSEAVDSYIEDINLYIELSDIFDNLEDKIDSAIESYYSNVEGLIDKKVKMLEEAIKSSGLGGKDYEGSSNSFFNSLRWLTDEKRERIDEAAKSNSAVGKSYEERSNNSPNAGQSFEKIAKIMVEAEESNSPEGEEYEDSSKNSPVVKQSIEEIAKALGKTDKNSSPGGKEYEDSNKNSPIVKQSIEEIAKVLSKPDKNSSPGGKEYEGSRRNPFIFRELFERSLNKTGVGDKSSSSGGKEHVESDKNSELLRDQFIKDLNKLFHN